MLSSNKIEPLSDYKDNKNYFPIKNDSNIILDGKFSESIWDSLIPIEDFIQAEPVIFSDPSQKTSVKVFYNNNALYFAVKIYDQVDKIVGNLAQYDDWFEGFENSSDYFIIELDSHHDHRTGYAFAVNSKGVKADYMIYNDDPSMIDDDWDQKWNATVYRDLDGWNIEYEIPFKILRFNNIGKVGINFIRYIKRNNEYISWVVLPREIEGLVSHYGHLNNLDIKKNKYISFKPYILFGSIDYDDYYYQNIESMNDAPIVVNRKIETEMAGVDLQYNLDNFSTFSLTINPDFGQIEQDPSEINLTAYETYFEEKRPFFMESSNLFNTPIDIFYSRRIGSNVKLNYNLSEDSDTLLDYSSDLNHAMKLTGKNSNGLSYGLILTESEVDSSNSIFNNQKINTSVVRITKDIFDGNSYFGFMNIFYRNRFKESNVVSFDGMLNFLDNKLNIDAQIINSINEYDNNKNDCGSGGSFEISYKDKFFRKKNNLLNDKIFETWFNFKIFDDNLQINDVGYLYRNDFRKMVAGVSLINEKYIKPSNLNFKKYPLLKNYSLFFQSIISKQRYGDLRLENSTSLNFRSTFDNFWNLKTGMIVGLEYFDDRLYDYYLDQIHTSLVVKKPKYKQIYFSFGNNQSKNYSFNISMEYFENQIKDTGFSYTVSSIFRPLNWINFEFLYNLNMNKEKYHFLKVRKLSNNGIREEEEDIYHFTQSDNLEKYITSRASIFFRKNISLQLYLEYFVNKNKLSENEDDYSILREDNNYSYPMSSDVYSLEDNYDILYRTNYSSLTTNFVFKWEYKQGSNLYFVYSMYKEVSGESLDDLMDLIDYKFDSDNRSEIFFDRSIYLKVDYWFDF